jgi:hypothetical protein
MSEPGVTRRSPAPPSPRNILTFAAHASAEAIHAHLQARRAEMRSLESHIAWLEDLLIERQQQIAAGTWPTHERTDRP